MHFFSKSLLPITLFTALGLAATIPASAQNLRYTFSKVVFDDGAVATGYFNYDPTADTVGPFDFTTTNGVTGSLTGASYVSGQATVVSHSAYQFFFATNTHPENAFIFETHFPSTSPGIYALVPGTNVGPNGFDGSAEDAPLGIGDRGIVSGSLIVAADNSPVPEASTTVSLGLLLALGLGGVVIAAKRKKASASVS